MDTTNYIPFRTHLSKFTALSDETFAEILPYFTPATVKKGDTLIHPGQKVTTTHWVIKGLLISTFIDTDGKEHVIQFANENCWITDQQAFYQEGHAQFTLVALEDTELLTITYSNREKLCATIPAMEHFFRKKANDSFVKQQKRLLTYMTKDATERFHLLLQDYPDLLQRVPKKILAAYLGVSRETLSRLKR